MSLVFGLASLLASPSQAQQCAPTGLGSLATGSTRGAVAFSCGIACQAAENDGLKILDVSDPTNPTLLSTLPGYAIGITVVDDLAYIGGSSDFRIADISDPTNPQLLGTSLLSWYGFPWEIVVSGNYAYLAAGSSGLNIMDVSDPSNPTLVGSVFSQFGDFRGVAVSGDYAYLVGGGYQNLEVIDVSNPASPTVVGSSPAPGWGTDAVATYAGRVFSGGSNSIFGSGQRFFEYDVSDPTNPTVVKSISATAVRIAIEGSRAYIAGDDATFANPGLGIFDLSTPQNPVRVGFAPLAGQPWQVAVSGDLAYGGSLAVEQLFDVSSCSAGTASSACGAPPTAAAGNNLSVDEGQAFVMLDGSTSNDPDGDPLTYAWAQTAGTTVALSNPNVAQPTFTAPLVGLGGDTLSFELTVTANGEQATDSVDVVVNNLNQTPTVTITSPADGDVTGSTTIALTADIVDEDGTTITSTPAGIAPGTLAAGGGSVSGWLPLAVDGSNDLIVSVLDDGGLTAATSIVVYRDTVDPAITISPAEGTIVSSPIPSFGITVNDQTETSVSIDGNPAGTATVPGGDVYGVASAVLTGSIPLWSEGPNSLVVSATDAAGNTTTFTRTVILDSTAPLVAIATPLNGACYGVGASVDIPLSATINDATATEVTGALSASLPAGGGTATGTFTLVEGVNDITVAAQDNAGAGLTASDTVSVTLDTIAPTVAITAPGEFDCVRGTIEFHATASDVLPGSVASSTFFVDGVALAQAALYSVDTTTLTDGPHQLSVEATDSCGNVSTASITIDVDNTAPTVTLSNPIDLELVSGTIDFDASATDGGSGLAAITMTAANLPPTVDGSQTFGAPVGSGSASSQVDTIAALGGADGLLELDVTAIDCAGNATTVAISVNVDNTAPGKAILQPADGAVVRCSIRITADASDPNLDTVQFVVDGVAQPLLNAAPFEMSYDTRDRLDGNLPITLIATDFVGNVSTCTINVTIDNLKVKVLPRSLKLKSRGGSHSVLAKITGQSADLLTGLNPADITLCVPGGSPIPSTKIFGFQGGWRCQDEGQGWHRGHRRWHRHGCYGAESKAFVKFDRKLLIGALRGAGITSGKVELTVKATAGGQTFDLGSSKIRVK